MKFDVDKFVKVQCEGTSFDVFNMSHVPEETPQFSQLEGLEKKGRK